MPAGRQKSKMQKCKSKVKSKIVVSGVVIKGLGLGKKYGLPPTMNLRVKHMPKALKYGIYAVKLKTTLSGGGEFSGVAHYGPRPTLHAPISFEVHYFGLRKNLLRRRVKIVIIKRLRGVKNFKNTVALKRQIDIDIKQAKEILISYNKN